MTSLCFQFLSLSLPFCPSKTLKFPSSVLKPKSAACISPCRFRTQATTAITPEVDDRKSVTTRSMDFNALYLDVIASAELADYGPVCGTMVIRPYGYAIWEAIQDYLNVKFKESVHSNMYFPQWIIQAYPRFHEGASNLGRLVPLEERIQLIQF